ncbi:MAG: cytochrome c biogenesis protein [Saprospiraceae bacterium]|nr:cytochrome c biogenesis protein [Saprospiraceae bacterium]
MLKEGQNWWKLLGVALVVYSIVAGMLVPLGPGIIGISNPGLKAGDQQTIRVTGYNTHYSEGDVNAWLRYGTRYSLEALAISIVDDRTLDATFELPRALPSRDSINPLSLVVHSSKDGLSVLPEALFLTGSTAERTVEQWKEGVEVPGHSGIHFPYRNILKETIRNTYYHVPLWFSLLVVLALSMVYAIRHLRNPSLTYDSKSYGFAGAGVVLGILGLATGAMWAKYTWGAFWSFDIKQNMAAIAMIIYLAYFILRSSLDDRDLSAKYGAVYNIFAYLLLIPLLYIFPRMASVDSLHPGSGGNPAFGGEDLDNTMRMVFYPAVIGWILIGIWIGQVHGRIRRLSDRMMLAK